MTKSSIVFAVAILLVAAFVVSCSQRPLYQIDADALEKAEGKVEQVDKATRQWVDKQEAKAIRTFKRIFGGSMPTIVRTEHCGTFRCVVTLEYGMAVFMYENVCLSYTNVGCDITDVDMDGCAHGLRLISHPNYGIIGSKPAFCTLEGYGRVLLELESQRIP